MFLHLVAVNCSEVSGECTASVFRWSESVDAEVSVGKKCFGYMVRFEGVWSS